jgi:hypothetical protein
MTDKKVLIGVMLDVSGSMKQSIKSIEYKNADKLWVQTIFTVINDLIKNDVS